MRRTKIVCTIGPSCSAPEVLREVIKAGMDVARLNFSHGTPDTHRSMFLSIRNLATECNRNVAILVDLQGPRIRTGSLRGGTPVFLKEGERICITARAVEGDASCITTTYDNLPHDVVKGNRILIADGTMELHVEEVNGPDIQCRIVRGGMLGEHKGMNLPDVQVTAPSLTEKDEADLALAMELGADYVALSFVRTANDLQLLRERMEALRKPGMPTPGVVAKIERPEAVANFDAILECTDAVMVARGDLGIETPLEDIPQTQKSLIRQCNAHGVPVITATQMLESMIEHAQPTRAEVNDVANAIYDGTDAVMLSGETASGKFPVEAVRTMAGVAAKADEAHATLDGREHVPGVWHDTYSGSIAEAVNAIAHTTHASRVVCFTSTGHTARAIARYRPPIPVTAMTLSNAVLRRCALIWGVDAVLTMDVNDISDVAAVTDVLLQEQGLAERGDTIIIVAGTPLAVGGITNILQLHCVGSPA